MYKLLEIYQIAKENNYYSLILLIEYLVEKRKVLTLNDELHKLDYYLQDKFKNKMNEYLAEYEGERQ